MKFSISKGALQELLQVVVSAVPAKSTLPILSNILIEADKEGLTLVATDLDISIRTRGEAEVTETGPGHRAGQAYRRDRPRAARCGHQGGGQGRQGSSSPAPTAHSPSWEWDRRIFPSFPRSMRRRWSPFRPRFSTRRCGGPPIPSAPTRRARMLTGRSCCSSRPASCGWSPPTGTVWPSRPSRGSSRDWKAGICIIPPKALSQVVRLASGQDTVNLAVSKNFAVFEVGPTTDLSHGSSTATSRTTNRSFPRTTPRSSRLKRDEFIAALRRVAVLSDTRDPPDQARA